MDATLRRFERFDALVLTASVWFMGKFLRYAFPPLFGTLGDSYGVSRTALGTAFTGFMLVYAVMQFPSGLLADRVGSVRVVVAGCAVTALGAFALVVDSPFLVLAGAMVLMGGGTGTFKTVSVELLSRVYPDRTGRVLGVFDTFGSFAGAAAPAAVVVVTGLPAVFGAPWRTLFLAGGLATVALTLAFAVRVPRRLSSESPSTAGPNAEADDGPATAANDGPATAADDGTETAPDSETAADGDGVTESDADDADDGTVSGADDSYLSLFRRWQFTGFVVVTILFSFAYNGAISFLPLYLASETTLTATTANLLFSTLFLVSIVQVVTGDASDRFGTLPVIAVTLGAATLGLVAVLALSATGGPFVLGAAVVTLGLGAHGYRPVRGAYLMNVVPDSVAGGGLGIVRTLQMVAGASAPAIVGYLSETTGFGLAFGLLAVVLAASTALSGVLWVRDSD